MQFLRVPLLAFGLLGSLASSSPAPTPSFITSAISGTSPAPLATGLAAYHASQTGKHHEKDHVNVFDQAKEDGMYNGKRDSFKLFDQDYVGHSKNKVLLEMQRKRAMDLVPVSDVCTGHSYCYKDLPGKKYLSGDISEAMKNITVSMEQVETSPLTIEVKITNNSTGPITFWLNLSPISSYAFDLGYFDIYTDVVGVLFGKRTRAEAHGYRPASYSDLTELGPGAWVSARIKLPENPDSSSAKSWRKMLEMSGDITIMMHGNWYGIWAATREQVMRTDMDYSKYGFNFWNDLFIPWEATFPTESQKCSPVEGCRMRLELK
ncbi:hypothetical protein FGADI_7546 [Fusarium gaditjirri]|uniref:Neprosin domain-containing protein n=1 Tax=Fusarium gaditjirri TaxID=282569 RepID=A0A8H4WUK2_9HYPO|nr:hypothetical protein FGADI_7546 [Fusarium gaditjirri]